jgi:hypothetical protein
MNEKEQVNRRNTRVWVKMNEDAKSSYFRNQFIHNHGGKFVKEGRYWKWVEVDFEKLLIEDFEKKIQEFKAPEPVIKVERGKSYVFQDREGKEVHIKNLLDFCMENKLVRGAMYDLMSGKRKTYKGYKFLRKEE